MLPISLQANMARREGVVVVLRGDSCPSTYVLVSHGQKTALAAAELAPIARME